MLFFRMCSFDRLMCRYIGNSGSEAQLVSIKGSCHPQFPWLCTLCLALSFKDLLDYGGYIQGNCVLYESMKNLFPFKFISANSGSLNVSSTGMCELRPCLDSCHGEELGSKRRAGTKILVPFIGGCISFVTCREFSPLDIFMSFPIG